MDENKTPTSNYSEQANKPKIQGKIDEPKGLKKFIGTFIADDVNDIFGYLGKEVLIPSLKNMVYDIFREGIDTIFLGKDSGGYRGNSRYSTSRPGGTSYEGYYAKNSRPASRDNRSTYYHDNTFVFKNVIVENRAMAEEVLDMMSDYIYKYGVARVSDLYDYVNIPCEITYEHYGWYSINDANIRRISASEYLIDLPKPTPINR